MRLPPSSFAALALLALPACTPREEKAVEVVEAMADVFEKHGGGDCDKLADRLDALVRSRADDLDALAESDKSTESRERSAKYKKRIEAAVERIVANAGKCGAEPRVAAALKKIF
jgi:phage-related tail protein